MFEIKFFLSENTDDRLSSSNFGANFELLNPDPPHPHPESAFGMRIQETRIMRFRADADP
jgi:hypothetical protein